MGSALADVDIPDPGNEINFTAPGGIINFNDTGVINASSGLKLNGVLTADGITVGSGANLVSDNMQVVTGGQLYQTNQNVAAAQADIGAAQSDITTLQSQVGDLGTSVATNSLNVASGALTASSTGVSIGTNLNMGGNKITNLANGDINASSTDAVNGRQVYDLFFESGTAGGVRYFRAKSAAPDSEALGEESIAIGPNSVAEGDSSFAAGDGAKVLNASNGTNSAAAIAIGKDSESSGVGSTAIGQEATASGGGAIALGSGAKGLGASGIALGTGAEANAENNISIGSAAGYNANPDLAGDQSHNIAIGAQTGQNVRGQFNVAMGDQAGSNVAGNDNVALGRGAGTSLVGDGNVTIGWNANSGRSANRAVGIGQEADAETEGVAIGYNALAGNTGVALGRQTTALGTGTAIGPNAHADSGFVALGLNSWAVEGDVSGSSRFTNRSFEGSAVSVGSSQAGSEFTRRIVNVEDGANDTDAVNVRQLQQAVSGIDLSDIDFADGVISNLQTQIDQNMLHYVSINDNGIPKGNNSNNGADAAAIDSIAIGPDATTKNRDAVAIGHLAGAEGDSAVVLGHNIKGLGRNSTTIGNSQTEARDESGVAIGTHVVSRDQNSIVIGRDSYTDRQASGPSVENSIVIGTSSRSTAAEGIVIGRNSLVNAPKGIAQGSEAHATEENAMAFGTTSRAAAVDSQASGTQAQAYAARGIAMGTRARSGDADPNVEDLANNRDSIAIGSDSIAEMNSSIAMGREAEATANYAQALGYDAQASGEESIAQGRGAIALEQQAIALGAGVRSTAERAVALGAGARSTAADALALGAGAQGAAANAVAVGRGATAANARSVALGDGSVTDGAVGTTNASLNGITYGNFAGNTPVATVSVGTALEKRTVTNVAAGRISSTSTDAINGSQLYATNAVLGNLANTTVNILGGDAQLAPNGSLSMSDIGDTGENTVHDAIKYAAQGWNVSADGDTATNVAPGGSVDFGNTDENIEITRTSTGLSFDLADDIEIGNSITVGDTVIEGDSITTSNLTVGGETRLGDNFVVNNAGEVTYNNYEIATQNDGLSFAGNTGSVIDKTLGDGTPLTISGELAAGEEATGANLRVDSASGQLNLVMAQNLTDLSSITINNGGPVIHEGGINMNDNRITNLAPGVDGTDAVNVNQLEDVETVANRGWDISANGGNTQTVAPGDSVNFADDGNVVVSNSVDADGNHTVDVGLADDITVDSVALNGTDGTDGLTMRGAQGAPGLGGADGITRIVYEDADGTVHEVATMDDGLNFAGNTGDAIAKKLGETLTVSGGLAEGEDATGANLRVDSENGQLNLVMAQDLTDLNSITINNGGPVIHEGGINMNNKHITNLAPGVDGTDAVNVDQLEAVETIANRGWDLSVNGEDAENVAPGDEVNFSNTDDNIRISQNGTDLTFNLNPDIDLTPDGSLTIGNTLVNNDGLTVADSAGNKTTTTATGTTVTGADGTTTVGAGSISVADAAGNETTVGGTKVVVGGGYPVTIDGNAGIISGLQNKDIDYPEFADGSGRAATEEQLGIVNDAVGDLADTPLTFAGDAGSNVERKLGETVNLVGGAADEAALTDGNIGVVADGADTLEIKLNKDVDLGPDGSVTTGNTVMDNTGLTVSDTTAGTLTSIGSGAIALADSDGNVTTMDPTNVTVGGAFPITINGSTGVIAGLQNKSIFYGGFADGSGRAATEEQLGSITNFLGLEEGADGSPVFNYNGQDHTSLAGALDSMHWNVEAPAPGDSGGGLDGSGSDGSGGNGGNGGSGNETPIHNGNTVGFVEGDNIVISKTERPNGEGADIKVSMAQDISVNSITAVQVDAGRIQADEIQISNGGPVINENGIDMSGKPITNVAAGVNETDAVNVGQLQQATGNLQGQVNSLRNDVRRLDNKLSAGVAAAMATAALPQAYLPGKNMMAMAGGTWNGESGMAIGFSGITDNGKWIYKLSGNATSRGDYGGAVGIGYQW